MSYFSLPSNSHFKLPSVPCLGETLLLIQTKKNLPISVLSFFEKNMKDNQQNYYDQQNSLQLSLNNHQNSLAQMTQAGTTPKKKRTGCICKKTKCLKMYCECFASGKLCTPQCVCYGCNNHQHCESLIQKAKESIKHKNQIGSDNLKQFKGCNCKKSMCQKKYCECFNAGLPCGQMCKCQQCANNDGSCSSHHSHNSIEKVDLKQFN